MIERTYIHVGGPSGAGKTTFTERVLNSTTQELLVARAVSALRCGNRANRRRQRTPN